MHSEGLHPHWLRSPAKPIKRKSSITRHHAGKHDNEEDEVSLRATEKQRCCDTLNGWEDAHSLITGGAALVHGWQWSNQRGFGAERDVPYLTETLTTACTTGRAF